VNNARYIDYLQDARADFLYELGIERLLRDGFSVISNQMEYLQPVFFSQEPLEVDVTVTAVDEETVTLAYQLYQHQREVAVARTTLSGYDVPGRTRRPLPDYAHTVFASMVTPEHPLREIAWSDMNEHAKVSEMRVRWTDVDAYGYVNNAMIFDYVQEGRITFTAAPLRGMTSTQNTDYLWLLARQDAWYMSPVHFRKDPYVVRTGISRLGTTSVTFSSQVDDPATGAICARAAAVAVFADAAGRPTELTPELREALNQYSLYQ